MRNIYAVLFMFFQVVTVFSQTALKGVYEYIAPDLISVKTINQVDVEGLPFVRIDTIHTPMHFTLELRNGSYIYKYPNVSRVFEEVTETGHIAFSGDTLILTDTVFNEPYAATREYKDLDNQYIFVFKDALNQPLVSCQVMIDDKKYLSGADGIIKVPFSDLHYSESNIKIFKYIYIGELKLNIQPFNTKDELKYANYFTIRIFSFKHNNMYIKTRKIVPSGSNKVLFINFDDQNSTMIFFQKP